MKTDRFIPHVFGDRPVCFYTFGALQLHVPVQLLGANGVLVKGEFRPTLLPASSADGDEMGTKRWGQGRMSPNRAD